MVSPADIVTGSAADFMPRRVTLKTMAEAAQGCRGCPLFLHATQAVFGEGRAHAELMLVGEQPGDQEDLAGRPFVGPSGRVLDEALQGAGIDRATVYVTNAVKHFKWEPRGKRRLHKKPSAGEVKACRPWLMEEIRLVEPRIIMCLGATAAQSLMGNAFRLTQHRGEFLRMATAGDVEADILSTVHPSSLLRIPDATARRAAREAFAEDFVRVAKRLQTLAAARV